MKRALGLFLVFIMTSTVDAQDWANFARFEEANAALGPPTGERVVFMGDSITEAWDLEDFFDHSPYVNRGISGQTTPQMLVRFRADVIALQPQVVVILAGTNDIAGNTGPTTLETIAGHIRSMAELAHANGIGVVISSVLPASDYPWQPGLEPDRKIPLLNEMLREIASANNFVYLDYFEAMSNGENGLQAAYTTDGVHVTAAGYAVMARLIEPAIARARTD